MRVILLGIVLSVVALAQQPKKPVITWTDTVNPVGTTYKVKRAAGLCTGTPSYSTVASGVAEKTYRDTTATIGAWCYTVTANFGGSESVDAIPAAATILPEAPTIGTITFAVLVPPTPEVQAVVLGAF